MKNDRDHVKQQKNQVAGIVALNILLFPLVVVTAQAEEQNYFNPALLELNEPGQGPVDLSVFSTEGGHLPGTYWVDLIVNNARVDTRNVEFKMLEGREGKPKLLPCFTVEELAEWGVLTEKYPELRKEGDACARIEVIPQASADFRFGQQQLVLSFPQSAVRNSARGWVDPKKWDNGITALLLNYDVSASKNSARQQGNSDTQDFYLNLQPGFNLGAWRLRNYSTWRKNSNKSTGTSEKKFKSVYTYIQRDLINLKSRLTMGESTTPAEVFDSTPFLGVQIQSDEHMLPESLRGYAPVVRGIARTNAKVTIKQNNYVIYESYVSPGSFEITDMYPTGGAGDLYVHLEESDGTEQNFIVPFASLPVLQREHQAKYGLTLGTYRPYSNSIKKAPIAEGSLIYGLPAGFTLFGGAQLSKKYQAFALGMGKNFGSLGAFSLDVTHALAKQKNSGKEIGQSWRLRYNKNFVQTGTNFALAGYRYATSGYWTLSEVLNSYQNSETTRPNERKRNRAEFTVSQYLGDQLGSIALTAVREDYWVNRKRLESYGVSYNNAWKGISYGISYTRNRNTALTAEGNGTQYSQVDELFSINFSVPLFTKPTYAPRFLTYGLNSSKNAPTSQHMSMGGTLLEDNSLNWSLTQGYTGGGQGNSGGLNLGWSMPKGEHTLGYAYDSYSRRLSYGLRGGAIVHGGGVTFGQSLSETSALVAIPDAKDVAISGEMGVKTDSRGYAIVPYVSPYRKNEVTLDTHSFDDETEIAIASQTVVPTRGAVVRASYDASVGYRALITLKNRQGENVPFGATVTDTSKGGSAGFIVGDNGQVYITGLSQEGTLSVSWGGESSDTCQIKYQLPAQPAGINELNLQCE